MPHNCPRMARRHARSDPLLGVDAATLPRRRAIICRILANLHGLASYGDGGKAITSSYASTSSSAPALYLQYRSSCGISGGWSTSEAFPYDEMRVGLHAFACCMHAGLCWDTRREALRIAYIWPLCEKHLSCPILIEPKQKEHHVGQAFLPCISSVAV